MNETLVKVVGREEEGVHTVEFMITSRSRCCQSDPIAGRFLRALSTF